MIVKDVIGSAESGTIRQGQIARAVEAICSANESACWRLLGQSLGNLELADRREEGRHQISLPFYLFPVEWMDRENAGLSPLIAVTRDFSTRGIGFHCDVQVPLEQIVAEFDGYDAGRIRLVLEIRWRRRQSLHSYLAGGRIVSVLSPMEFAFP